MITQEEAKNKILSHDLGSLIWITKLLKEIENPTQNELNLIREAEFKIEIIKLENKLLETEKQLKITNDVLSNLLKAVGFKKED